MGVTRRVVQVIREGPVRVTALESGYAGDRVEVDGVDVGDLVCEALGLKEDGPQLSYAGPRERRQGGRVRVTVEVLEDYKE